MKFPATLILEVKNDFDWIQALSIKINSHKHLYEKLMFIKASYPNLKDYKIFIVFDSKVNDIY